jgi:plastocyanin
MRRLLAVGCALALAGALAVPALAATKTITLRDNVFSPKAASVAKGTTVRFVWKGKQSHNVFLTSGPPAAVKFHSPVKTRGSYSKTLTRSGTYRIVCQLHPGMKLTLEVS